MREFKWTYWDLLEVPKDHLDWIIALLKAEGEKARHEQREANRQKPATPRSSRKR